jgi:hypothetical protein
VWVAVGRLDPDRRSEGDIRDRERWMVVARHQGDTGRVKFGITAVVDFGVRAVRFVLLGHVSGRSAPPFCLSVLASEVSGLGLVGVVLRDGSGKLVLWTPTLLFLAGGGTFCSVVHVPGWFPSPARGGSSRVGRSGAVPGWGWVMCSLVGSTVAGGGKRGSMAINWSTSATDEKCSSPVSLCWHMRV